MLRMTKLMIFKVRDDERQDQNHSGDRSKGLTTCFGSTF